MGDGKQERLKKGTLLALLLAVFAGDARAGQRVGKARAIKKESEWNGYTKLAREVRRKRAEVFGTRIEQFALKTLSPNQKSYFKIHKNINKRRKKVFELEAKDSHLSEILDWSIKDTQLHFISDLHWGAGQPKKHEPQKEDTFVYDQQFKNYIEHLAKQKTPESRNLINIGGDWLELTQYLPAHATPEQVKALVTKIIEVHKTAVSALVTGVVKNDFRVIYQGGNHDPHLADVKLRRHLLDEMARVAKLDKNQGKKLKARVAFSGHAAFFGKSDRIAVFHGHASDGLNNVNVSANPYIYSINEDGKAIRVIEDVAGAMMAREFDEVSDLNDVLNSSDGLKQSFRIFRILGKDRLSRIFSKASEVANSRRLTKAELLAQKSDDRLILRLWAPAFQKNSVVSARKMHHIYDQMPTPLHREKPWFDEDSVFNTVGLDWANPIELLNFLGTFRKVLLSPQFSKIMVGNFISLTTQYFDSVNTVLLGHDHREAKKDGTLNNRKVRFSRTGYWGPAGGGGDILSVVPGKIDSNGKASIAGLHRWNDAEQSLEKVKNVPQIDSQINSWKKKPK